MMPMTSAEIEALVDDSPPGLLGTTEYFWRDHYKWLKECGYLLRPRYAPGWVPSWEVKDAGGVSKEWNDCEDGQTSPVGTRCFVSNLTRVIRMVL